MTLRGSGSLGCGRAPRLERKSVQEADESIRSCEIESNRSRIVVVHLFDTWRVPPIGLLVEYIYNAIREIIYRLSLPPPVVFVDKSLQRVCQTRVNYRTMDYIYKFGNFGEERKLSKIENFRALISIEQEQEIGDWRTVRMERM